MKISETTNIDYEKKFDRIELCSKTKTALLYGDPSLIPDPWLTVIVPTYKREDLIAQTLESLFTQWPVDYPWDIIVVDNEQYLGKANETEKLIRKKNHQRVLYYRNEEHLCAGDNFNKGISLARGKWVMFLHDDDLLTASALLKMGKLINYCEKNEKKPLGSIVASYLQFFYDPISEKCSVDIPALNAYFSHGAINYGGLFKVTRHNVLFTGHTGGSVPSNGTTFLREAVISVGGFNEPEYGISGDLVLFYNMERKYSVFQYTIPLGFYRWGRNQMIETTNTFKTVKAGFDFREYVYSKNIWNKLVGRLLRKCHYKKFTSDVISDRNSMNAGKKLTLSDFDSIYDKRPSKIGYFLYTHLVMGFYNRHKQKQMRKFGKNGEIE